MGWYTPTAPPADLADAVVCTWSARVEGMHRLVPDGCVDVLWVQGVGIRVCGPEVAAWSFTLPGGTEAAGVRFRPGVAPRALGTGADEIRDTRVALADLSGDAAERRLSERVEDASAEARADVLGGAARRWLRSAPPADPVIAGVGSALGRACVPVQRLADHAALSERQLHRRCRSAFGYGPSTLRSILRLQRFMALARRFDDLGLAALATMVGYADQPQLTRECRRISGVTPTELLAGEAPDWHGPASVVDVRNVQDAVLGAPQSWVA